MKNLKKKQSVMHLIKQYGAKIILGLTIAAIVAFFLVGGYVTSLFTQSSFWMGIVDFGVLCLGGLVVFIIVFMLLDVLYCAFTYVRTFFRYAYLPLTVKEACSLGLDKDPVKYCKTLVKMMCYKRDFTYNFLAFQDDDTDIKLAQLFYQLFFYKNDIRKPVILEYLNNMDKLNKLIDSLIVYENKFDPVTSKDYSERSLVKYLKGFYDVISLIKDSDQIIDVKAFKDACCYKRKGKSTFYVMAILQTKNTFYLISGTSWLSIKGDKCETIESLLTDKHFKDVNSLITIE